MWVHPFFTGILFKCLLNLRCSATSNANIYHLIRTNLIYLLINFIRRYYIHAAFEFKRIILKIENLCTRRESCGKRRRIRTEKWMQSHYSLVYSYVWYLVWVMGLMWANRVRWHAAVHKVYAKWLTTVRPLSMKSLCMHCIRPNAVFVDAIKSCAARWRCKWPRRPHRSPNESASEVSSYEHPWSFWCRHLIFLFRFVFVFSVHVAGTQNVNSMKMQSSRYIGVVAWTISRSCKRYHDVKCQRYHLWWVVRWPFPANFHTWYGGPFLSQWRSFMSMNPICLSFFDIGSNRLRTKFSAGHNVGLWRIVDQWGIRIDSGPLRRDQS